MLAAVIIIIICIIFRVLNDLRRDINEHGDDVDDDQDRNTLVKVSCWRLFWTTTKMNGVEII